MHKIAKNRDEAWELQELHEGKPHGWVQWKGTDVCMDIHCKCGFHSHIDDEFAYNVECPNCGTVYMCNGHIEFIEVEDIGSSNCVVVGDGEAYDSKAVVAENIIKALDKFARGVDAVEYGLPIDSPGSDKFDMITIVKNILDGKV